jgi:ferredoxin
MDVCLGFDEDGAGSGSGRREIGQDAVDAILREAVDKLLVPRPFRSEDRSRVAGVCFCCDDCCWYFQGGDEPCDKGARIESTDLALCSQCDACVDVCHFGARGVRDGLLVVDRDACHGCGLCVAVCPIAGCLRMVPRQAPPLHLPPR